MQLPEHVELCPDCGMANAHDLTIPKWVFREVGECFCADPMEAPPDEPIGHEFHREMHEYRVQKGEIEE